MTNADDARCNALEARARRIAARNGYIVRKSRRQFSPDNLGEFMLINDRNCCVLGEKFDASADDVITYFTD